MRGTNREGEQRLSSPHPRPRGSKHPVSRAVGAGAGLSPRPGALGALACQQAGGSLLSTGNPLLRRKASCLGSRPRKSFSMTLASWEPPGLRMQLL